MKNRTTLSSIFLGLAMLLFSLPSAFAQNCPNTLADSGQSFPPAGGTVTITNGTYATMAVTAGNIYSFATCGGAAFDTMLDIYDDATGTGIAGNDDACGLQSTVTVQASADGTWRILLYEFFCNDDPIFGTADITATVTLPPPPPALCPDPSVLVQAPNQVGNGPGGTIAATSDANPGFQVFDDFVASSTSVSSISWWGVYVDFNAGTIPCGPGTGDDFTISYHTDGGGGPDVEIASFSVSPASGPTGIVIPIIGGLDEYGYQGTHAPVTLTVGDTYWVSVQNNSATDCFWLWSTAPPGTGAGFQIGGGGATTYDLALCLGGATDVPVPTMGEWGLIFLTLITLTFGAVFMTARRRQLAGAGGNITIGSTFRNMPFEAAAYGRILLITLGLVSLGFAIAVVAFGYSLTNADIPGILICTPVLAYLLFLLKK
ncbi:MAG: IPTL-CTERM sorting domain-containing protein [Bacteroidota bacterium]